MKIDTDPQKIEKVLTRGVEEVIKKEHLQKRLLSGEKLRIKFGIDPTGSELHLGHSVPLRKLKQFQELGHQVILLIGDYTAKIGDPSGKNETRPMLTDANIKKNMKTYIKQASKVLNIKKVELRYNSEWYKKKGAEFMMELTSKITIARILERDDFKKRLKEDIDIQAQEILYPLLQGYDSVALKADVELGGTDQKFNLLMGRKLQKRYGQPEQDIITTPILEGLDGVQKMSKSLDNYIALMEKSKSMYGKIMSLPDTLMWKYFILLTDIPLDEIEETKEKVRQSLENPRDLKMKLAREIVKAYYSEKEAQEAEAHFVKVIQKKEIPEDVKTIRLYGGAKIEPHDPKSMSQIDTITLVKALKETDLVTSKSEARRKIKEGAVKVEGKTITDINYKIELKEEGILIQKGKRHFIKVVK